MDFTIDADQRALVSATRELTSRHSQTAHGETPVGPGRHNPEAWRALIELGALALPFSEDDGGLGASAVEVSLVANELGRAHLPTAYLEALVAAAILQEAGEDAAEVLADLLAGEELVVIALNEPGRAWAAQATVKAEETPQGWRLTGVKEPVLYAGAADRLVISATTSEGPALFLIDAAEATDSGRVALEGASAQLLLIGDAAVAALKRAINLGTAAAAGEAVGAMEAALDLTVEYLKSRKQFGVPLMTFQALTQRAADMYVSLELARSSALYAALVVADDPDDSAAISRVKAIIGRTGRHIGQEAIQLHGGIGVTAEYQVAHLAARLADIGHSFGDTRQQLSTLAAGIESYDHVTVMAEA